MFRGSQARRTLNRLVADQPSGLHADLVGDTIALVLECFVPVEPFRTDLGIQHHYRMFDREVAGATTDLSWRYRNESRADSRVVVSRPGRDRPSRFAQLG